MARPRAATSRFPFLAVAALALAVLTLTALTLTARPAPAGEHTMNMSTLTEKQRGIIPISAFTASGDMPRLDAALRAVLAAR